MALVLFLAPTVAPPSVPASGAGTFAVGVDETAAVTDGDVVRPVGAETVPVTTDPTAGGASATGVLPTVPTVAGLAVARPTT